MLIIVFAISLLIAVLTAQQAVNFMEPRRSGWALTAAFIAALIVPFAVSVLFDIPLYADDDPNYSMAVNIFYTCKNLFFLTTASAGLTVLAWCGMEGVID